MHPYLFSYDMISQTVLGGVVPEAYYNNINVKSRRARRALPEPTSLSIRYRLGLVMSRHRASPKIGSVMELVQDSSSGDDDPGSASAGAVFETPARPLP